MLAAPAPTNGLDFPLLASAKLDGIRCVIKDGRAYSRKLELIPNRYVQSMLGHDILNGLDGELIVGPPYAPNVMQDTTSGVMSHNGEPDFVFYVFDYWNGPEGQPYAARYAQLQATLVEPPYSLHPRLQLLEQFEIADVEQLTDMQEDYLERGYEGLILRNPDSPYKFGRSTDNPKGSTRANSDKPLQEWTMLKLKKFSSGEARIVACNELMVNENEDDLDALGHAKRSKAAEGLRPGGVLGSFSVVDCVTGVPFSVGSGFDAEQRATLWAQRAELIGKLVRYKHFEIGVKTAPRFPIFLGFRDPRDMGEPA